ncbi:hypothetical protein F5Y18DRAFT_273298 [Xylariaceae sp. FL1019]|nr:hypothetical protein F5Y18DRAFT_273298 [Xylariaceae sp. FL1019]
MSTIMSYIYLAIRPFRPSDHLDLPFRDIQRYYWPNHPTMQELERACTNNDIDHFKASFYAWRQMATPQPPLGPPDYPLGTLDPIFYHAIRLHRTEFVAFLLSEGVRTCRAARFEAIEYKCPPAMWEAFLEHGHYNIWDSESQLLPPMADVFDNAPLVEWFLKRRVNPNTATSYGLTIMLKAIGCAPLSIIKMLHESGGDISRALPFAVNPEPPATKSRSLQIIRYLLDAGAHLDASKCADNTTFYRRWDNDWGSALNGALSLKRKDLAEHLLRRGARVDIPTLNAMSTGETARELAARFVPELLPEIELRYLIQKR